VKVLLVYDSAFGNTEKVAKAVADVLKTMGEVEIKRPDAVGSGSLKGVDLLVVASPTQGGRATKPLQAFMDAIPADGLAGIQTAAFDTGMKMWIARLLGYASKRMARQLQKKGGKAVAAPEVFFVAGRSGPLVDGELERAREWAGGIVKAVKKS